MTKNPAPCAYPVHRAGTAEGAASWDWAFSVRAVPYSENRAAGALLTWYYFSDRILYDQDEF
ncbi:hypothetical protein ACFYXH_36300 [Streptomyces sp. NPDC002730]|uniref:hypothetical protein n=1 Tax=Streptomyces sp. NPDC002730 TaxID=3364662 RepID=UPI003693F4DF